MRLLLILFFLFGWSLAKADIVLFDNGGSLTAKTVQVDSGGHFVVDGQRYAPSQMIQNQLNAPVMIDVDAIQRRPDKLLNERNHRKELLQAKNDLVRKRINQKNPVPFPVIQRSDFGVRRRLQTGFPGGYEMNVQLGLLKLSELGNAGEQKSSRVFKVLVGITLRIRANQNAETGQCRSVAFLAGLAFLISVPQRGSQLENAASGFGLIPG